MKTFTKLYDELTELGVPVRLVQLYGILQFMAGEKGECWPTQKTLAEKMRLKSQRQVENLLNALQRLKLVQWKRGQRFNAYRVLNPDRNFISGLIRNKFRITDTKSSADHHLISEKNKASSNSQQASSSVGNRPSTLGLLAEIGIRHGEDLAPYLPPPDVTNPYGRREPNPEYRRMESLLRDARPRIQKAKDPWAYVARILLNEGFLKKPPGKSATGGNLKAAVSV